MARPRRPGSRQLPPNLYRREDSRNGRVYFAYRDKRTGKFHGLGQDEGAAIADALALNAAISAQIAGARVASLTEPAAPSGPLMSVVLRQHLEYAEQQHARGKLTANTMKGKHTYCRRMEKAWGKMPIESVGVREVAELLDSVIAAGHERTAQALRSEAIEVFKSAIAAGITTSNPALMTRAPQPVVNRSRLTLDVWRELYARADGWLKNAMALAIVTAQRREDIAAAQFADVRDGHWWVEQGKTGNRVALPLSLRLDAVGLSLADVVSQCRQTGIVSRYMIHQTQPFGNSPVGARIFVDTISKRFAELVAGLNIAWSGKTPPTWHEQRALSIQLHQAEGHTAQEIAGHRDARTTGVYLDKRGEWVMVSGG